ERDVDLGGVDLLGRVGDAGLGPQGVGGVAAGLRVGVVAAGEGSRLGAQGGGVDPGDLPAGVLHGLGRLGVADHDRARAVGGRAGLVEADRVPQHLALQHLVDGDLGLLEVGVRVDGAVEPVLDRHHGAHVLGGAGAADVGAHVGGEV